MVSQYQYYRITGNYCKSLVPIKKEVTWRTKHVRSFYTVRTNSAQQR